MSKPLENVLKDRNTIEVVINSYRSNKYSLIQEAHKLPLLKVFLSQSSTKREAGMVPLATDRHQGLPYETS